MSTDCSVCMEALFDNQGICRHGEVALIMCPHLVHSDCLVRSGQALNSDGQRYGIGGFGLRSGCPLCSEPVSFWTTHSKASDFSVFWLPKIQKCMETIGHNSGWIPVSQIQGMLQEDSSLTPQQKSDMMAENGGFEKALSDGELIAVKQVLSSDKWTMGAKNFIWAYEKEPALLWLHKWGDPPALL